MSLYERSGTNRFVSSLGRNSEEAPLRRSIISGLLLTVIIAAVSLSPRLPLDLLGIQGDIRVQDIVLLIAVAYLSLAPRQSPSRPMRSLLPWLPGFIIGSSLVVVLCIVFMPSVAIIARLLYWGRSIELFALASVVAVLFGRSGPLTARLVFRVVYTTGALNIVWVLLQWRQGIFRTVFGLERSSTVESYGPQLIGEPSAFGTGQYFAFLGAVAAARIMVNRKGSLPHFAVISVSFFCAYIAESRISAGVIMLMAVLVLIIGQNGRSAVNVLGLLAATLSGLLVFFIVFPTVQGRFSWSNIQAGLNVRLEGIWEPLLNALWESPLLGVGPGGLVAPLRDEAHNIFLRALLDYGLIVGPVFIGLFAVVLVKSYRFARFSKCEEAVLFGSIAFFVTLSTMVSGLVQDALTGVTSSHLVMVAIGLLAAAVTGGAPDQPQARVQPGAGEHQLRDAASAVHLVQPNMGGKDDLFYRHPAERVYLRARA